MFYASAFEREFPGMDFNLLTKEEKNAFMNQVDAQAEDDGSFMDEEDILDYCGY